MVHDVNLGRDAIKLEDKTQGTGPTSNNNNSQTQVRKSSLPQNNVTRNTIYGYLGTKSSDNVGNSGGGGVGKDDYDEIDQIYDYVRGFAPLPKSAKGWQYIADTMQEEKKEPIYQKLTSPADAENKPPEPPPIETIPGRKVSSSPMDVTPPMTPPFSPPWTSPVHAVHAPHPTQSPMMTPLGPNGQMIGIVPPPHLVIDRPVSADHTPKYEKVSESKKRQRPKTADTGKMCEGLLDAKETPNSRYVKATNKQNSTKHKFFRSRAKEKDKEVAPPPMCNLSTSTFYKDSRQPQPSHPSFFNLRYKSLTNLAHQVICR